MLVPKIVAFRVCSIVIVEVFLLELEVLGELLIQVELYLLSGGRVLDP